MTDPTAHWSPSEVDDDGDRSSYPPPAPLDLDAIEARAKAREYICEVSERDPVTGARLPPCGSVATWRCVAGGDCGARACDAHAVPFSGACDHRWERDDEGADDLAALVARVRELEAALAATEAEAEARTTLDALHKRCDAAEAERRDISESIAYVGASCDREIELDGVWLRASRLGAPSGLGHYAEMREQRDEWRTRAENAEAKTAEAETLAAKLGDLLRATADALKGPPPPLFTHSTHNLPEVAYGTRASYDALCGVVRAAAASVGVPVGAPEATAKRLASAVSLARREAERLRAEVAAVTAERDRESTARRDYESCIAFETACVSCAKALDAQLAAEERAEKAEAQLAAARPVLLLDAIRRGHVGPSTCARCGAPWRERDGNCEACGHPDTATPTAETPDDIAFAEQCAPTTPAAIRDGLVPDAAWDRNAAALASLVGLDDIALPEPERHAVTASHVEHRTAPRFAEAFEGDAPPQRLGVTTPPTDDDPANDGTDAAHPAWWRGNDAGCKGALALIARLRAEVDALKAARGVTTPPTDDELADEAATWIVTAPHSAGYAVRVLTSEDARRYRDTARGVHVWHLWDERTGCPAPRPAPSSAGIAADAPLAAKSPRVVFLHRPKELDPDEHEAAARHFVMAESRLDVRPGDVVIARHFAWPWPRELFDDLRRVGAKPVNDARGHAYAADLLAWTADLGELCPASTDRFETLPELGPFIVKGEKADKGRWARMFASTRADAIRLRSELMADSGMRGSTIVARQYVPLAPIGDAPVPGSCPLSAEFRVFVAFGRVLSAGYYWPPEDCDAALLGAAPKPEDIPAGFLSEAIARVAPHVDYFTLDVGIDCNGRWWVIEVSDGLRAGMSENDPEKVYAALAEAIADRYARPGPSESGRHG